MSESVFEKHPKRTIAIVMMVFLLLIALLSEILLRFIISYNIGYYTAVHAAGAYEYPYGTIHINSAGFPDEEFDRSSPKKRIGYFGDSVTFGVGAGEGYRFSDLLQKDYPSYEHWTFAMIANGIQDESILKQAQDYKLDTVVYLFNMNDLLPVSEGNNTPEITTGESWLRGAITFAARYLDGLRDKSYLYNTLRTSFKNLMMRMGYGHTGFKIVEQYPKEHEDIIRDVAKKVNDTAKALQKQNIDFCLVILPYEMQISDDAAETYRRLGINWEDGFEQGSTQDVLRKYLIIKNIYDGQEAFRHVKDSNKVGTYFVYNKGDKIDYNHPNREGHALLTKGFKMAQSCSFLQ